MVFRSAFSGVRHALKNQSASDQPKIDQTSFAAFKKDVPTQSNFLRPSNLEPALISLMKEAIGAELNQKEISHYRQRYSAGTKVGAWVNCRGMEFIGLESGSAYLNGRKMVAGDAVRVNVGDVVEIETIEDAEFISCAYLQRRNLFHVPLEKLKATHKEATANADVKVSIIIAAKNIENYIGHCILSCICQSHRNLQIIVVNDGSSDQTSQKVETMMRHDPRIELHQVSLGVNGARKFGLEKAGGRYSLIIDGDDWLAFDAIERILHTAIQADSQCVAFGHDHYNDKTGVFYDARFPTVNPEKSVPFIYERTAQSALETSHFNHTIWMYLFSTHLKDRASETLIDVSHYEDLSFYINLLQYAQRPMICNYVLYHYRRNRSGQATGDWSSLKPSHKRTSLNIAAKHALSLFHFEEWFYQLVLLYKLRNIINYEKNDCKINNDEMGVASWEFEWRKLVRLFPYELTDKIYEDHVRAEVLGALSSRI